MGHDVTVLTGSAFREDIYSVEPENINFQFIDYPPSRLSRLGSPLGGYETYQRWQDAALRHVQRVGGHYDVAHHVTWGGLHLGSQLWRLPVPFVYGPAGGGQTARASYWRYFGRQWPLETVRTLSTGPLLQFYGRCRDTVRNAAVTLVCNSETAAVCTRLGAKDVRYMLADGLEPSWIGTAGVQPTGVPVVLYIGRLLPRKAPTLAVEAFAELRRKMPARMIIAGDGPLRDKVRATVERLGVSDDVEMLGAIPYGEVKSVYDSASVLLFPSLRESFGAPFIEALGRGLPTVALDHQGIADADVGDAAVKVQVPADPRELPGRLAAGMEAVLSDGEWQTRSQAGHQMGLGLGMAGQGGQSGRDLPGDSAIGRLLPRFRTIRRCCPRLARTVQPAIASG